MHQKKKIRNETVKVKGTFSRPCGCWLFLHSAVIGGLADWTSLSSFGLPLSTCLLIPLPSRFLTLNWTSLSELPLRYEGGLTRTDLPGLGRLSFLVQKLIINETEGFCFTLNENADKRLFQRRFFFNLVFKVEVNRSYFYLVLGMVGLPCLGEFSRMVPQKERENAETLKDQPVGTRRPTFFLILFVKESIHCSCPFKGLLRWFCSVDRTTWNYHP